MSLRPEGSRLLVIRSMDGTVLYEGDGRVQVGMDPAVLPVVAADQPRLEFHFRGAPDRDWSQYWDRPPDDSRNWGVSRINPDDSEDQETERTWGDMVRATIRSQIRDRADTVHTIREAYGFGPEVLEPPSPAVREYWDALYDTARRVRMERETDLSAWEGRWRTVFGGRITPEARDMILGPAVTGPRPEHDELIESTRAEFPYDPLDYGRFGREEMSWSPPEDGQEVPRCP